MSNETVLVDLLFNMFNLQDELNNKIDKEWKTKRSPIDWRIAIFVEAGELIESLNWKWWKKQKDDLENVKMEIIDIWHFGISAIINTNENWRIELINKDIPTYRKHRYSSLNNIDRIHHLISEITYLSNYLYYCHKDKQNVSAIYMLNRLFTISELFGLDFENDIYLTYITKNVLNIFRQEHGYREGKYIKNWNGKEDNQVAQELLNSYLEKNISLSDIPKLLEEDLKKIYQTLQTHKNVI